MLFLDSAPGWRSNDRGERCTTHGDRSPSLPKGQELRALCQRSYREKKVTRSGRDAGFRCRRDAYERLEPYYVVIGGGNVEKLDSLPRKCRRGDNKLAFEGGFVCGRTKKAESLICRLSMFDKDFADLIEDGFQQLACC